MRNPRPDVRHADFVGKHAGTGWELRMKKGSECAIPEDDAGTLC
jgi:hypothetical protein